MSEQDHLQYFSGRNSISIKDVAHEYLKKLKPSTIPMAKFNFRLSDVSDLVYSLTEVFLHNDVSNLLSQITNM